MLAREGAGAKVPSREIRRTILLTALAALSLAAIGAILAPPAAAETPVNDTHLTTLLVLQVSDSPFILDHDLHVDSGGFLLVGDGVELRVDNGSKIYGDGGAISAIGTGPTPAVIGPRPGSNFTTWGGIELRLGSTLTLRHARIVSTDRAVTMFGVGNLDAQFAEFMGCGSWCVSTDTNSQMSLKDAQLQDGVWAVIDSGALSPVIANTTATNFSAGGLRFDPGAFGVLVQRVNFADVSVGIFADGLRSSTIGPVSVVSLDAAFRANGTIDVVVHNATLRSSAGPAFEDQNSGRITLRDGMLNGSTRALSLLGSSAAAVLNTRVTSLNGSCLYLFNATNSLFRGTALDGCMRSLEVDPASAPPTADADRTNTVDGRPWLWIANGAGVVVGILDDPGLLVLASVSGASVSDLRLSKAGIHIFGSSAIVIERVLVDGAEAGLEAIGTRGLTLREFIARNVTDGIRIRTSSFYVGPSDLLLENIRIEGALNDGISVADVTNASILHAYARAGASGANLTRVNGALVRFGVFTNSSIGLTLNRSVGITVVDSVIAGSTQFGMFVFNSTGLAARNAFLANAQHASAPSSPGFPFNEAGGGNYWEGFTAANANGDAFYDTPYNLPDATGSDARPRVARFDFFPTVIVSPPGAIEVGSPTLLDASYSFDDFVVATIYWTVDVPGRNDTASGPLYAWRPNASGNFTLTVEAQDSAGGVSSYSFLILVRDSSPPVIGDIVALEIHVGGNATFTLPNATDNDRTFPANATVSWSLTGPAPSTAVRFGSADNLSFDVPISQLGSYTLSVTLHDRWGNTDTGSITFQAIDTDAPQVEFLIVGEPDLGVPFLIDLATAVDPAGIDQSSGRWSWFDASAAHNATGFPSILITFAEAGNHTVTLRLCDRDGNCGNTSVVVEARDRTGPRLVHIRVIPTGHPTVDVLPDSTAAVDVERNGDVVFEIGATDPSAPMTFNWTFPDGTHQSGTRVTKGFAEPGVTVVTVTMTDSLGNSNTTAVRLNVKGGNSFFDSIPGGVGGLVVLVVLVAAGVGGFVFVRRRNRKIRLPP